MLTYFAIRLALPFIGRRLVDSLHPAIAKVVNDDDAPAIAQLPWFALEA
jgi:hypothetical protein